MRATVRTWFAQLFDAEVNPVAIVLNVFAYELDERRNVHIDLDVAVGWMLERLGFGQEFEACCLQDLVFHVMK